MPSIDNYQLIGTEMKEYYETNKFFVESAFGDIAAGKFEPKKDVDYKIWPSSSTVPMKTLNSFDVHREKVVESLQSPKLYTGNFEFDTGNQLEENHLVVCPTAPSTSNEDDDNDLIQTFNEALRTEEDDFQGVMFLSHEEILNRLSNPNILSDMQSFSKLPRGVQKFMEKFPFFKNQLQKANEVPIAQDSFNDLASHVSGCSSDKENTAKKNSMIVPNISASPFTPLSETSNKTPADRNLRSLPSRSVEVQSKRDLLEGEASQSSQMSKKVNRRMDTFIQNFSQHKRRRDSTSPSAESSQ